MHAGIYALWTDRLKLQCYGACLSVFVCRSICAGHQYSANASVHLRKKLARGPCVIWQRSRSVLYAFGNALACALDSPEQLPYPYCTLYVRRCRHRIRVLSCRALRQTMAKVVDIAQRRRPDIRTQACVCVLSLNPCAQADVRRSSIYPSFVRIYDVIAAAVLPARAKRCRCFSVTLGR